MDVCLSEEQLDPVGLLGDGRWGTPAITSNIPRMAGSDTETITS